MASSGSYNAAQEESNSWLAQALTVQLRENHPWLAQALTVQLRENLIHG